jgi:uncharacterized protein
MIFLCDVMLGKLAKYLRILGLNTVYVTSATILDKYKNNNTTTLFFTKRILKKVPHNNFIYIRSNDVLAQLTEIRNVIKPYINSKTFMKRCIQCNTLLNDAKQNDIEGLVPEFIFHTHSVFKTCPLCMKIYWQGSHVEHMGKRVKEIIQCD